MPPSSSHSAATRAAEDDEDHAPPETEISDSDIADADDEREAEIEEFEEIEVEVEEEDIEEEENDGDDISVSPIGDNQDRNDVSKDMESKGHDRHLGSGSSTPEKSKARLPSNGPAVGERSGDFKSSGPSNKPLRTHKEESYVSYEDFRYPKSGKPLAFAEDNESRERVVYKKDAGVLPKMKIPKSHIELLTGIKAHLCNNEIVDAETSNPFSGTGKEVAVAIPTKDHFGEGPNSVLGSEEETKQRDMQSGNDKKRMASRSASPEIRARSLSLGAEIKDGNKRPAVICDFYAKGWCIKGSSCRFLHIKDNVDNISQRPERDIAAANGKGEVKFDEGLRHVIERSRSPGFPDPLTSSVGNNTASSYHFSSESVLPLEHGESPRLHQFQENHKFPLLQREDKCLGIPPDLQQLPSSKDDLGFNSSFKDVGRESLRRNWPVDDYDCASLINKGSSPSLRNSLLPEYRSSSGSVISSNNYQSVNPSSYGSSLGDLTCIRSQYMLNDHSSPVLSHSLNSSLSTLPTTGNFPSHRISAWKGSSFSSSLNASPLGAKKLFDSDRDYRTSQSSSLLRSSSPFSGLEPENLPLTNVSGDPPRSADYRTKISSNDWEPSVPFRPSFFITPTSISSPGSQYDPLRDSIDLPNIVDRSSKFSFSSPGASILSTSHQQIYGDSILTRTVVLECNDDKNSVSFPNRFHESVLDRNCYSPGKDSLISGAETVGTSVVDGQNGTTPKEENPSVPLHGKDVPKTNKTDINHDSRHQSDGSRHKKDSKVDRVRQNNEMDVEFITDGEVHQESKAMRHFRAALVDLVKELLKPTWREGNLSKDAHITIVKKAVDKVLSTLQPRQIFTMESIKQYLSSSRPKIAKLVEAYVDKYGKS